MRWTYGDSITGPGLRIRQGEPIRIRVENGLPEPTFIHWNGIRLANDADGVPGMTQEAIEPGAAFTYAFTPRTPGRTSSTPTSGCSSTAASTPHSSSRRAASR